MLKHIIIIIWTMSFWGGLLTGQSAFSHEAKNWEETQKAIVLVYQSQDTEDSEFSDSQEITSENAEPNPELPPNKFNKFLEDNPNKPPEEVEKDLAGMGTGFWIDNQHVVTNYHVIKNMDQNKIQLWTAFYPFPLKNIKVVGVDKSIDLAVLRVETKMEHPSLKFAKERVNDGETVYAIGHGLSLVWSVTSGIISNNYRQSPQDSFVQYYQTDAVINPGNSGGPLINEEGEVVGVNVLILSPNKFYIGYGYSIPSILAERVVSRIIMTGSHKRPGIGIQMSSIDDEEAYLKLLEVGINSMVLVKDLSPDMPAKEAGIKQGDIIVSANDEPIIVSGHLIEALWKLDPGDVVKLGIYRGDNIIYIEVPLVEIPAPQEIPYGR
jgi:serine protease Do